MHIIVATESQIKTRALIKALENLGLDKDNNIESKKSDSKVSNQPFGFEETISGAKNRVLYLENETFDICIAIENGIIEIDNKYFDLACVYAKTKEGFESMSFSSAMFVPNFIIEEIKRENTEFGIITKRLSGSDDKDPMKYFSDSRIKREDLLSQAIELCLIQIINKDKYIKV